MIISCFIDYYWRYKDYWVLWLRCQKECLVDYIPNSSSGFSSLRSLRSLHDVTKPASGWQRVGLHSPMAYLTLGSPQSGSPSLLAPRILDMPGRSQSCNLSSTISHKKFKITMQVPAVTKDTVTRTIKPYYRKEYIVAVQVSYNSQMPI